MVINPQLWRSKMFDELFRSRAVQRHLSSPLWRRKRKQSHTANPEPTKPAKHWSEEQGTYNLLTESLTLDQLCGVRAHASNSSCCVSERTPHNGNRNKTGLLLSITK